MMPIDFSRIKLNESENTAINPKDIFKLLVNKDKKYSYLRDVQSEVLSSWFKNKDLSEHVIKMNTGSGKTVVGLLLLKSCLNEKKGPAVYVVPDNYLLVQVENEAKALGVETTTDTNSLSYIAQESILIVNAHKLFNGNSVFGVGAKGTKIPIGTILIDDAHASIDKIEDQFTLQIPKSENMYNEIVNLFEEDLKKQSETKVSDISNNVPDSFILLPYWALQNKITKLTKIIEAGCNYENKLIFNWLLLKDNLHLTDCIITNKKIEFSIRVIPTKLINSYENAQRKIIMTATLPDDSILITHLNIKPETLLRIITPLTGGDIGERMILVPEYINPYISKDEIKKMLIRFSENSKVVVIVPSEFKSAYWEDKAICVIKSDNINDGLANFKKESSGLIVIVNKYDGIDLPDDDCRILVIDELPDDRSEIEKIDANILRNYENILARKIRKIEQGMGRAIRSNEDYSAVVLLGKTLVNHLYTNNATKSFTIATQKQLELSNSALEQIKGKDISEIESAIDSILSRDKDWVSTSRSTIMNLNYEPSTTNPVAIAFRKAYNAAWIKDYQDSSNILDDLSKQTENECLKGWVKFYLSMFTNFSDEASSQLILKSALKLNSDLLIPIEGIKYQKINNTTNQAINCIEFLKTIGDTNKIIIKLNSVFEDLMFLPETSNQFEEAIRCISYFIGFKAHRPEKEFGIGPDNLWSCGELVFLVIECKNGCTTDFINKHDTNQLNGSINWFLKEYDSTCKFYPIMIHPSNVFEHSASPNQNIRIMNSENLDKLKRSIHKFILAIASTGCLADVSTISERLNFFKLTNNHFVNEYTISYKKR